MQILSHKLEELHNLKYNTLVSCQCDNPQCNKVFTKQRKFLLCDIKRGRKNFFCCRQCVNEYHSGGSKGEIFYCIKCHKEVLRRPSRIEKSGNVFCSRKCSGNYNVHKNRWKNHVKKIQIKQPKQLFLGLRQCSKTKEIKFFKCKRVTIVCLCNCAQCNKDLARTKSDLSDGHNKNKLVFCSRSCRMTYQNINNPSTRFCNQSKPEKFLFNLIKTDFPLLDIEQNNRKLLPSKLEIDILIPKFKLAIELNGPVHYFPIYGEDKLKNCQHKDIKKQQEIHDMGLSLLVLDISRLCSKKKTTIFLTEYYISHIKPILENCGDRI